MRRFSSLAVLLFSTALLGCQSTQTVEPPPPTQTEKPRTVERKPRRTSLRPDHIPQAARAILADRMLRHGDDMNDLLWAMLFLDHQTVHELSALIADEPRFARPLAQDASELNAQLPAEFFTLQDELKRNARELSAYAKDQDHDGMAAAFGTLSETCVRCHTVYMNEPPTMALEAK